MARILVVADESWVRNEVHAALSIDDHELIDHQDPRTVTDAIEEHDVDVVVVDLQLGSMGGMAVTRAVRDRADSPAIPVVILIDRAADAFLAKRAGAHGWVVKPFTAHEIRTALDGASETGEDQPA